MLEDKVQCLKLGEKTPLFEDFKANIFLTSMQNILSVAIGSFINYLFVATLVATNHLKTNNL